MVETCRKSISNLKAIKPILKQIRFKIVATVQTSPFQILHKYSFQMYLHNLQSYEGVSFSPSPKSQLAYYVLQWYIRLCHSMMLHLLDRFNVEHDC